VTDVPVDYDRALSMVYEHTFKAWDDERGRNMPYDPRIPALAAVRNSSEPIPAAQLPAMPPGYRVPRPSPAPAPSSGAGAGNTPARVLPLGMRTCALTSTGAPAVLGEKRGRLSHSFQQRSSLMGREYCSTRATEVDGLYPM